MKDLSLMHYYLGLELWQKRGEIFLGKGKYVVNILHKLTDLRKLRDSDFDPVDLSLYQQLIGSLMYLVNTRSDIFFFVNMLS